VFETTRAGKGERSTAVAAAFAVTSVSACGSNREMNIVRLVPSRLVMPHKSHVTRHTSHVTRHTSHVTRHTSHVTRHTSHVTRHTSHVTRQTPPSKLAHHTCAITHSAPSTAQEPEGHPYTVCTTAAPAPAADAADGDDAA
jgi:hypothetical protein